MACLNDARLQAVADGEGTDVEIEHVRTCTACSVRVADARDAIGDFGQLMSELPVPPTLGSRVAAATSSARRGATTLRDAPSPLRVRPAWVFAAGAVAAVMAILFVVFPSVDPGTRLNASEILNRSLQTFAGHGIERLEYELSIDVPTAVSIESGTFRIEQLIDHDRGRWRFARFATDGTLVNGISEDPTAGVRDVVVRKDGRSYRFRFRLGAGQSVPLWDIQRRYAESMIRMVQVSAGQIVTEETTADGQRYVVELRDAPVAGASTPFDLGHARIVIDASDFHVIEFTANGLVLGDPVSVGYRLIERVVGAPATSPSGFDLPRGDAGAIELEAEGTKHIPEDVLALLLREVAHGR